MTDEEADAVLRQAIPVLVHQYTLHRDYRRLRSPWPWRDDELRDWWNYRDEHGNWLSCNQIGERMHLRYSQVARRAWDIHLRRFHTKNGKAPKPEQPPKGRSNQHIRAKQPTLPPLPSLAEPITERGPDGR